MPREKLNELALRRPDFAEGTPVVMADGQAWQLRRPLVWFVPCDRNPSGWENRLTLDDDDDYQELLDEMYAARDEEPSAENAESRGRRIISAQMALARRLLLANYDLDPGQLARVLRFSYTDRNPEGARIREEVLEVAEGLGKEPSPDGTESPDMPSVAPPG